MAQTALQHMQHSFVCLFDKPPNVQGELPRKELAMELGQNLCEMERAVEILSEVDQVVAAPKEQEKGGEERSHPASDSESSHEEFTDDGSSETSSSLGEDKTPTSKGAASPMP